MGAAPEVSRILVIMKIIYLLTCDVTAAPTETDHRDPRTGRGQYRVGGRALLPKCGSGSPSRRLPSTDVSYLSS